MLVFGPDDVVLTEAERVQFEEVAARANVNLKAGLRQLNGFNSTASPKVIACVARRLQKAGWNVQFRPDGIMVFF